MIQKRFNETSTGSAHTLSVCEDKEADCGKTFDLKTMEYIEEG